MIFSRLFGRTNALLLEYDHLDQSQFEILEEQIAEVGRFYQFAKLSELVSRHSRGGSQGLAAIFFKNPRKSVLLRAVPLLLKKGIPFTIFLRPDCIGLNKLPPEEELALYQKAFPARFSESEVRRRWTEAWRTPELAEHFLLGLRGELGPLPLQDTDPTFFFCTWGRLEELPKDLVDWGLTLYAGPRSGSLLENGRIFIRQQVGCEPLTARRGELSSTQSPEEQWMEKDILSLGLKACVGFKRGAIAQESQLFDLDVWHF